MFFFPPLPLSARQPRQHRFDRRPQSQARWTHPRQVLSQRMQGGVLKALETCSGGQAAGVSAQDSARVLTLWHLAARVATCVWQAVYPVSKARKSPPIWQKFEGNKKTRENGARKER